MFSGTKKMVTAKESQSLTSCHHQQGSSGTSLKRYNAISQNTKSKMIIMVSLGIQKREITDILPVYSLNFPPTRFMQCV